MGLMTNIFNKYLMILLQLRYKFCILTQKFFKMNHKEKRGVLLAGGIGFLAVFGLIMLRKFLNDQSYDQYYNDFHRHFEKDTEDEHHGVEYLAMQ